MEQSNLHNTHQMDHSYKHTGINWHIKETQQWAPVTMAKNVSIVGIFVNQMPMTLQVLLEISYVSVNSWSRMGAYSAL